jgi:hypothetical protein
MQLLPIVRVVGGSTFRPESLKYEVVTHAQVDDEHFEYLNKFRWSLSSNRSGNYPHRYVRQHEKPRHLLLHREVAALAGWDMSNDVDHADHDVLNAQISNLRLADKSQNGANAKLAKNNTSGFKGVSWDKIKKKYAVYVGYKGRHVLVGRFADPRMAARAFDYVVIRLFGPFAHTNKAMGLLD